MTNILVKTIIAIVLFSCTIDAETIYSLIKNGKLAEASDSLSVRSNASSRDGDDLFCQSLLEENAIESVQKMEAALRASVSATFRQEIYHRLAQYYFISENYNKLSEAVRDYRTRWENGKYRREMLRYSVFIDEKNKKYEAAIRQLDRYLLEYNDGYARQWGLIDKSRIMVEFKKKIAARKLLRTLSKESSGPGVAQALYMLADDVIKRSRTDDAVFYYNLCREAYPSAIGLDATIEKMSGMSASGDKENRAEARTGTFYSIQVGVFSSKSNAKKRANEFKKYDKKVDIKSKKISDKNYNVVYVGHFTSYNSALTFKKMLESKYNETFQVKAR